MENKHTAYDLAQMQSLPLDLKITMTKRRIRYGDIVCDPCGKWLTTQEHRTGCIFCGFGAHLEKSPNRFERLKQTHPQLWEYCMKPWDEGGLGFREVLTFCGIKTGESDK